jgi:predicted phosphodiesterase
MAASKTLKRVGAIGDIHGEDIHLEAALEFLAGRVERVLAVGDIVDGPGDVRRCCQLLTEHEVEVVMGNHDRWLLDGTMRFDEAGPEQDSPLVRDYLDGLPATRSYDTQAGRLLLCHGLGDNDMRRLTPDDYGYALETNDELQELLKTQVHRFVIGGHTHRRMVKDFGGVTVINVGTLFREHEPCFTSVDFVQREVSFYQIGSGGRIELSATHPI